MHAFCSSGPSCLNFSRKSRSIATPFHLPIACWSYNLLEHTSLKMLQELIKKLFTIQKRQLVRSNCDAKQRKVQIATQRVALHCDGCESSQKRRPNQFSRPSRLQKGTHRRCATSRFRTWTQLARPSNHPEVVSQGTTAASLIICVLLGILTTGCAGPKTYRSDQVSAPPVHHYQISVAQATNTAFLKSLSWPASIEITNWDLLTQ